MTISEGGALTRNGNSVAVSIAICFSIATLEGFDIQALGVAAPRLVPDLALSAAQMGWIFSAGNIGLVFGALMGGLAADRFGRKRALAVATFVFGLCTLALAATHGFSGLLIARVLAGLGFGGALAILMAIATDVSDPDRRASTAALMFCGMPLGGGTVALITQVLPPAASWRSLFVMGGVLSLLVAIAVVVALRESAGRSSGASGSGRAALTLLFGGDRARPTLLIWVASIPTLLILYLILNWLPLLAVAKGLARQTAPQAALAFNYGSVVGALVFGWLVDRLGSRWPLSLGYGGVALALLWLGHAAGGAGLIVASGAAGFFVLGTNYALYGVIPGHYPADGRATGAGAAVAVGRVGSIIGPLLAGYLINGGATADSVILRLVPPAVVAGIAVFLLSFHRPDVDAPGP